MAQAAIQVKDSETEVLSSLGISETPALVVLIPDGETVKYDGESYSDTKFCLIA